MLSAKQRAWESERQPMGSLHEAPQASPFLKSALSVADAMKLRGGDADGDGEALYLKVLQVAWEDDIVWGIDLDAAKIRDSAAREEQDDDDMSGSASAASVSEAAPSVGYQNTPLARSSIHGTSSLSRDTASSSSTVGSFPSKGYATQSYKGMNPRKTSSAVDAPWVPSTSQEDFDMTKPRVYCWEIKDTAIVASGLTQASSFRKGPSATAAGQGAAGLPCPLNRELDDGSWLDAIGWGSTRDMPESKLVLDENDASLIIMDPDVDEIRPILRIPERKLAAAEIDKRRREKDKRLEAARTNIDYGNGAAKFRTNTEGVGKKYVVCPTMEIVSSVHDHSLPAIRLSMTKPELSKSKLRQFHRPRSKFKLNERMAIAAPPVASTPPVEDDVVMMQIKKSSDLSPAAGGKLILVEFTEQNPPMLSNPGMAARILHYWRPRTRRENGPEEAENEASRGDVPPNRVVTSLNSKLYKVPIFEHKPVAPFAPSPSSRNHDTSQYELFILCRSATKGKKGGSGSQKATMHLFDMPDLYVAGQVEPQMEVPAPNSRSARDFIRSHMSFHIRQLFKKASDGESLKIEDVARVFSTQSITAVRKRMKEAATFERGGDDSGWWRKKPASQLPSEDELRVSIPPESVCLYESMMAGHRRLLDIGLTKLIAPTGVNDAIDLLLKRLELRKQALSAALIEPLQLERRAKEKAERDVWERDSTVRKLATDIQVARYIHEQLQLTPWNRTNNYVSCHLQNNGPGMLQIGGIGDPTGRGEGFSFVREPQSRAKANCGERDGAAGSGAHTAAVQKTESGVTGTSADLRKLKMKEAGLVLRNLGIPEADIRKLRRWDRIHLIRELTNVASAHDRAGVLSKFARGTRKSLSAQQEDYRHKCDVVYKRQLDVLSSTSVTFSDDEEPEDDSDSIDELEDELCCAGSFGGDARDTFVKLGPKNLFAKDGGGLNRSKEALAEREDAVELERLMSEMKEDSGNRRPDVDASKLRNQLRASGIHGGAAASSSVASQGSASGAASTIHTPVDYRSRSVSPASATSWPSQEATPSRVPGRKVLKRTTRVVAEDGTESVRIEFIVDGNRVRRFLANQQRQQETDKRTNRKRTLAHEQNASGSNVLDVAKRRK